MLDERWSPEVEEVAAALRKVLDVESSILRVRAAEQNSCGYDAGLEDSLRAFGLDELQGDADLFARVAFELGRSLASTPLGDTLPVLALTGRAGVALAWGRPVPAALNRVAVRRADGVYVESLRGKPRLTTAGDALVEHEAAGPGEFLGEAALADRLDRYAALTEAARLVGAGQELLRLGTAYAGERRQFGKIIGTYQGVAHRLANAASRLDAAELLVRKTAFTARAEVGGDGAPATAFSMMVRSKAIEAARGVATDVHQVFGGNGFGVEYDVQLYSRRLRSWAMRAPRAGGDLAALGRLVLDPARRDALQLLWHFDKGMPLPRWAAEADRRMDQPR
jgi:hypothetical protein